MTNTEKRAAVMQVVGEWGFMSNLFIAEKAGVTEGLVRKMKKEFGGTWPNHKKEFEDLMFQIGLVANALAAGGGDEQKAMEWAKANLGKYEADRQKYIEIGKECLRSEMTKDMKIMEEESLPPLQQRVLDLLQEGRATVAALVSKLSMQQLQAVIGDLEKID